MASQIIARPGQRLIPLTQGISAIVDEADYEELAKFKWHAEWSRESKTFYVARTVRAGGRRKIYMHRVILEAPNGIGVDHKDGHGWNNGRDNIRLSTASQNSWNHGKFANNTSGFKGVCKHPCGKWMASISANKKQYYLGLFDTTEDASAAYVEAAKRLHGEFAKW